MEFQLDAAVDLLRRTPAVLDALLRDLPDELAYANEGPGSWSPYDIVGHMIHGEETDWIPRARIILEYGETRAFEPFDREAMFEKSKGRSLTELLEEFALRRGQSLEALGQLNLNSLDLQSKGTHPELGMVTLEQLIATWVVHDLNHVAQIARVISSQHAGLVGPWRAYLSILNR